MKVGYKRVSSVDQNPERQLEGLELDKVFLDMCSGKDLERPRLQELLTFLREGDVLFVHCMDRLARNLQDLKNTIDHLTKKGVTIVFVKENLTFNNNKSPISDLILAIVGAIAEFEHALIRERQLEGIAIAKKKGIYTGRKPHLTIEQKQDMYKMIDTGFNKSKVAKHFKMSRETVYRYLRERKNS